ncbi:MAG: hypothetical protein JKY61_12380 [Planctomycetes bacterium]|nr:hypothetical protein [Planctomycetota bacterium]
MSTLEGSHHNTPINPSDKSVWRYRAATQDWENAQMLDLDVEGASPGDAMVLNATKTGLVGVATVPAEASAQATEAGRVMIGDGLKLVDVATSPVIIASAPPVALDGWDGVRWLDKTTGLGYVKGLVDIGVWSSGQPIHRPDECYFSAETLGSAIPVSTDDPAFVNLQCKDIDEAGGWVQTTAGWKAPKAGDYRADIGVHLLNNSGSEGVCFMELRVNGAAPAIGGRSMAIRDNTSRWPKVNLKTRLTLAADDIVSLHLQNAPGGGSFSVNGDGGGVYFELIR